MPCAHLPFQFISLQSAISLSNPHKRSPFTAFCNLTPELHSTTTKANKTLLIIIGICFRCSSIPPGYCFIPLVATLAFPNPLLWYALLSSLPHYLYSYGIPRGIVRKKMAACKVATISFSITLLA